MKLSTVLIISFFTLLILGSLLHFTHEWFKTGFLLHIFSALNESTWEHMKLLIAPTILVAIFQYFTIGKNYPNIFNSVLILLVISTISIPILFEPLRILLTDVPFIITILIFMISIGIGIYAEYLMLKSKTIFVKESIATVFILVIVLIYAIFSYYPPKIFLFKDPVSGRYGDTMEH